MDELAHSLLKHFYLLPDPRQERNKRHVLLDVIVISICGILVNCDGPTAIAQWAQHKENWLKGFLKLPHGIPSHDCIRNVLLLLKPEVFQACFIHWLSELRGVAPGELEQICIDGKTLRRSHDRSKGLGALELLSAWATSKRLSLGQVEVGENSNEIEAIPRLLDLLELKGTVVSLDAIGCQTEIAKQIVQRQGDYVIAVKSNQKNLLQAIQAGFEKHPASLTAQGRCYEYMETHEKRSGRTEERRYTLVDLPRCFPDKRWPSVKAAGRAVRRRMKTDGTFTEEIRYYIVSRLLTAKEFAQAVRQHWHIENKLHWVLDVVMREDDSRVRNRRLATNLAWLRRVAIGLLRQHPAKDSLVGKMRQANWSDSFLSQVLTGQYV